MANNTTKEYYNLKEVGMMKKLFIVTLVAAALLCSSAVAFGLNSPENKQGHGVFTVMYATEDYGPILGLEYGLTSRFAVLGEGSLGDAEFRKLELKYEISRNFGLVGGVYRTEFDDNPFIGVNAALPFSQKFRGILEADGIMNDGADVGYVLYEAGAKYYLAKGVNLRAGVRGSTAEDVENAFEIGVGFEF
jgi:hypothetical protein